MWWHRRGWNVVEAYAQTAARNPAIYFFLRRSWIKVYAPHHNIDRHYTYREVLDLAAELERAHVNPKTVNRLRHAAERIRGGQLYEPSTPQPGKESP